MAMNQKKHAFGLVILSLVILGLASFMLYSGWMSRVRAQEEVRSLDSLAANNMNIRYRFSGVSDDGEQGSSNRKEATSIHCTNVSATDNQVEVQLYQWNGTDVFTGTVNMPPNRTITFSTQNTTIYFDDVLLGGSPGTTAIFQGSGRVLSESAEIICTAQVLDPLTYPPTFATKLTMYYADGTLVGDDRHLFLPAVLKP
jgi:hypothetical protein